MAVTNGKQVLNIAQSKRDVHPMFDVCWASAQTMETMDKHWVVSCESPNNLKSGQSD